MSTLWFEPNVHSSFVFAVFNHSSLGCFNIGWRKYFDLASEKTFGLFLDLLEAYYFFALLTERYCKNNSITFLNECLSLAISWIHVLNCFIIKPYIKAQEYAFKTVSVAYSLLRGHEERGNWFYRGWESQRRIAHDVLYCFWYLPESLQNPLKCLAAVCSSLPGQSRERNMWVGCISQPSVNRTIPNVVDGITKVAP